MKVCIIGNGLVSLTLAKALVNKGIKVDIFYKNKRNNYDQARTLGISRSNTDFFNENILNIKKIIWKINDIKIFTENSHDDEILNFSDSDKPLFSIVQNYQLYKMLDKELKKNKFFNYKKNINFNSLIKKNYKLIINCDKNNEITKKFFSSRLEKNYNSFAYTTLLEHKSVRKNDSAIQIFTNKGPVAFLPISSTKTSIVCSLRVSNKKIEIDINDIIKKFNPKFKIKKISKISKAELRSYNLRRYYKNNILAFGDLTHTLHPLAGQGYNMSVRDIKELLKLIDKRVDLGLDLDNSICTDFQNKTKKSNYLFSVGIDWVYELFNFESRINSNILNKSINVIGKNKSINDFFKKFADLGLRI